jgi:DNA topoisomerase I
VSAEKKPRAKKTAKDAKPAKDAKSAKDATPAKAAKPAKAPRPLKAAQPAHTTPPDHPDAVPGGADDAKKPRATRKAGTLVVVESPAKASTIKKYLGAGYEVKASVGHIKDLPKATIGIDIENGFQPAYVVIDTKKKVIAEIKAAAKRASQVLLAPDPDREGEAIA